MKLSNRSAHQPRAAMRTAVVVAVILFAAGCAKDEPASSSSDQPGQLKTEMEFLAQYEPLHSRTDAQACDDSQPRCHIERPRPFSTTEQKRFNACMRQAGITAQEKAGSPPSSGETSLDWIERFTAESERLTSGCLAMLPQGVTLGYARGYGYGYTGQVGEAIASAQDTANMTGSPVDVVIN